jgi:hypothetical protein
MLLWFYEIFISDILTDWDLLRTYSTSYAVLKTIYHRKRDLIIIKQ